MVREKNATEEFPINQPRGIGNLAPNPLCRALMLARKKDIFISLGAIFNSVHYVRLTYLGGGTKRVP